MSKNKNSKSNKNSEKRGPGAPQKPVKFPRGQFTVKEVKALNPNVCGLTVIGRINDGVEDGILVKLKETLATKKAGRPSFIYMTKAMYDAARARRKAAKSEAVAVTPVETPISPEPVNADETQAAVTETPVETPVVAPVEAPAETATPEAAVVGGEPVAA